MLKYLIKWFDKRMENFARKFSKEILEKEVVFDYYESSFSESFIKKRISQKD